MHKSGAGVGVHMNTGEIAMRSSRNTRMFLNWPGLHRRVNQAAPSVLISLYTQPESERIGENEAHSPGGFRKLSSNRRDLNLQWSRGRDLQGHVQILEVLVLEGGSGVDSSAWI